MEIVYHYPKDVDTLLFERFLRDLDGAHYEVMGYKIPMTLYMNHNTVMYIYEWFANMSLVVHSEKKLPRPTVKGLEIFEFPWFTDGEIFLLTHKESICRHWHLNIDEFMC